MAPIPFADNFLAGSIISLVLPVGLLIAIAVWYVVGLRRIPEPDADPALVHESGATAAPKRPASDSGEGHA